MNAPNRYIRQETLAQVGKEGQNILKGARIAVVGCGALGTSVCNNLVRAGLGYIRILDGDKIDVTNLHRQMIFTEEDARLRRYKVEAAGEYLKKANSEVQLELYNVDVNKENATNLLEDVDLIVDATDNFLTRMLINDISLELDIPWVYGGALGFEGRILIIDPKEYCFRCLIPELPKETLTCQAVGVLGPLTNVVGSIQAAEVIKFLITRGENIGELIIIDLWKNQFRSISITRDPNCPACGGGARDFLGKGLHEPNRVFKSSDGNTYKLFGWRILVNDAKVLKSPEGCTDVLDVRVEDGHLSVKFKTGNLTISNAHEI